MRSLTDCGWELCKRGMTSLTEVMDYAEMMETEEKLAPDSPPITEPVAEPADPAAAAKKF
jgi:hypothetical protein